MTLFHSLARVPVHFLLPVTTTYLPLAPLCVPHLWCSPDLLQSLHLTQSSFGAPQTFCNHCITHSHPLVFPRPSAIIASHSHLFVLPRPFEIITSHTVILCAYDRLSPGPLKIPKFVNDQIFSIN